MMTLSNGNIFRVTGHLCGGFTDPGEFPAQRTVTRSFDVIFDLRLNKRLSKQSWGWWFETLSRPLWRHCNGRSKSHRIRPEMWYYADHNQPRADPKWLMIYIQLEINVKMLYISTNILLQGKWPWQLWLYGLTLQILRGKHIDRSWKITVFLIP